MIFSEELPRENATSILRIRRPLHRLGPSRPIGELGQLRRDLRPDLDARLHEHELRAILLLPALLFELLFELLETRGLGRLHERQARIDDQRDDDEQIGDDREEHLLEARERALEDGSFRTMILKVEVHQWFTRL